MITNKDRADRRAKRIRYDLKQKANNRHRLSIYRSNKHIYVQIIDDEKQITITSASSIEEIMRKKASKSWDVEAAKLVGALIAERAKKVNVSEVYFDRAGYRYHGRIKALADAAREHGMVF